MFMAHHARVYSAAASTRPSHGDPIYSASPRGERVEPTHIPHSSRNTSLLRQLTVNQQRNSNRSETATSPSGQSNASSQRQQPTVNSQRQQRSSNSTERPERRQQPTPATSANYSEDTRPPRDGGNSGARRELRVLISPAEQLMAREAARTAPTPVRTTSGGDPGRRGRSSGEQAIHAASSSAQRMGGPPGPTRGPNINVDVALSETPPVRVRAAAARACNKIFRRK